MDFPQNLFQCFDSYILVLLLELHNYGTNKVTIMLVPATICEIVMLASIATMINHGKPTLEYTDQTLCGEVTDKSEHHQGR